MDRLNFFCVVCGSSLDADLTAAATCERCDAGWRTMELAGGLLAEAGRGCHVVLRRFARDPVFQRSRILDLSFDPVIERELKCISTYRKLVFRGQGPREDWSDWQVPISGGVPGRLPFQDTVIDALIVRDLVRVVPDARRFIDECFRILVHGGSLILQDRYRWPFPDETVSDEVAAAADPADTRPASDSPAIRIRELGASLLTQLHDAGFIAYFERPAMSVDVLYRGGFAVGIKP